MDRLVIERMDGGPRLVIEEPDALAVAFFSQDASSVGPDAYDAQAGKGEPDRITTADIRAINQTMRARSPHKAWESLTGSVDPQPWLVAIDPSWDLLAMDEAAWEAVGGAAMLTAAIEASVGPYRQLSVATKVLHLKRPRLFPVLDSLVVEQLGGVGRSPSALLLHLRAQGRSNLTTLQAIQADLRARQYERTLVRILDAVLWSGHSSAGIAAQLGRWEHAFRRRSLPGEEGA